MIRRRFRHGEAFTTLHTALGWVLAENDVYFHHKFMSHKRILQWSISQIESAVRQQSLYRAEDVTDYFVHKKEQADGTLRQH